LYRWCWLAILLNRDHDATSPIGNNNRLELLGTSTINGNVVVAGGGANNVLALGGAVNSTFYVSQIGDAQKYRGFDTFVKTGTPPGH
jgi:fibronectin-binding autotransporter adhesin